MKISVYIPYMLAVLPSTAGLRQSRVSLLTLNVVRHSSWQNGCLATLKRTTEKDFDGALPSTVLVIDLRAILTIQSLKSIIYPPEM